MQLSAGQDAIVSFNHHNLNVFASASSNEAYVTMTTLSPGVASRAAAPFKLIIPEPRGASMTTVAKRAPV